MNNSKECSQVKYGKSIGLFEKISLKITGYLDGKHDFPRECEGQWISPFIDRELHRFEEYVADVWGQLQHEQKPYYIRLADLVDQVAIEELKASEPEHKRKKSIKEQKKVEISEIRNQILEGNQSACITCLRYWKYLEQRLAIYWRAVLKTHPKNSSMPAILSLQIPNVEIDYKKRHEALLQRAEELYKKQEVQ